MPVTPTPVRAGSGYDPLASLYGADTPPAKDYRLRLASPAELGTLLDVSRGLASTLNLEELLSLVLDRLDEVVGYRAASIQVIENNVPRVLQRRGPSISEYEARARLETGRDTTGYLARELSQGRFVASSARSTACWTFRSSVSTTFWPGRGGLTTFSAAFFPSAP